MSAKNWYSIQSKHNKKFSSDILHKFKSEYRDWAITALFYSALHLVNEYSLQHKTTLLINHSDRKTFIKNALPSIYGEYQKLFILSQHSRYDKEYDCINASDVQYAKDLFTKIAAHLNSA